MRYQHSHHKWLVSNSVYSVLLYRVNIIVRDINHTAQEVPQKTIDIFFGSTYNFSNRQNVEGPKVVKSTENTGF